MTIGVSAAVFSILDAVLWRALPVRDPAQLVTHLGAGPAAAAGSVHVDRVPRPIAGRGAGLSDVFAQSRHVAPVKLPDRTEFWP